MKYEILIRAVNKLYFTRVFCKTAHIHIVTLMIHALLIHWCVYGYCWVYTEATATYLIIEKKSLNYRM